MNQNQVAGAEKIVNFHAIPGVVDIPSNPAIIITTPNPSTAGRDLTPKRCGSLEQVVENFLPEQDYQLVTLNNLAGDAVETGTTTVKMRYGANPKQIMNDFEAEHLVVKAKDENGRKVLLEQRLDYFTLDNLLQLTGSEAFRKAFENGRESMLAFLENEIARLQALKEQARLNEITEEK